MLNDADLELAVKAAVAGRYQNTGQSLQQRQKRFIIEEGIASAFTERFVAAAAALKMGDPRDEENALGPMARFDLRDELHHQVEKTSAQGARLLLGGGKRWLGQVTTIRQRFWRMLPRNDRVSGKKCLALLRQSPLRKMQNMRWNWLMIVSSAFQRPFLPPTKHRPDRWRHVWNAVGCLSMVIVPATREWPLVA